MNLFWKHFHPLAKSYFDSFAEESFVIFQSWLDGLFIVAFSLHGKINVFLLEQIINYNGLPNQITQKYIYDDLNRLKAATKIFTGSTNPVWKQSFNYDRYGNRVFDSGSAKTLSQTVSWNITNLLINTADNILQNDRGDTTIAGYEYDKADNLVIDAENKHFIFDDENREKEILSLGRRQIDDSQFSNRVLFQT